MESIYFATHIRFSRCFFDGQPPDFCEMTSWQGRDFYFTCLLGTQTDRQADNRLICGYAK